MKNAIERKEVLDLHLHTDFSVDVFDGSTFEDFIVEGNKHGIIPGFLDHFQAEKLEWKDYPFSWDKINTYFEAYDKAKGLGMQSYFGLEVDFYSKETHDSWNRAAMDWIDDHGATFDYMVGTIHDVQDHTITIPFELEDLLKKVDFDRVQEDYFYTLQEGICSRMFNGFAHLDVVYRFCGDGGILPGVEKYIQDRRTWDAMVECVNQDIVIEVNIRGFDHPWNTTYPAENLLVKFKKECENPLFFVGSDAHHVKTFKRLFPVIQKYNQWIWQ
ncbi:MAG: PHP domain-containing protein [Candidatus Hodarchaeota archaeon]